MAQDQRADAVEYFTACPDREFALKRLGQMIEARLEYLSNNQD
jgi:hypothetical protein